jgi:hypothetical protein
VSTNPSPAFPIAKSDAFASLVIARDCPQRQCDAHRIFAARNPELAFIHVMLIAMTLAAQRYREFIVCFFSDTWTSLVRPLAGKFDVRGLRLDSVSAHATGQAAHELEVRFVVGAGSPHHAATRSSMNLTP